MVSSLEILALSRLSFYDNKPSFYAYQGPAQSILNNTFTPITFDTVQVDTWGGSGADTTKYTVRVAGKYLVSGMVNFAANANGSRFAKVLKNGNGVFGTIAEISTGNASNAGTVSTPPAVIPAVVGDVFQIAYLQNSGITLPTLGSSANTSSFTITFVGF